MESLSAVVLLGMRIGIDHSSSCLMEVRWSKQRYIILTVASKHFFLMCFLNFVLYTCELHPYTTIGSCSSQSLHKAELHFILWYSHFLWLHVLGCFKNFNLNL